MVERCWQGVPPRAIFRLLLLILVFATSGAAPAIAQEAEEGQPPVIGARRTLVFVETSPDSGYTPAQLYLFTQSLLTQLAEQGENVSVVEWRGAVTPTSDRERTEEAFRLGCDSWVVATLVGSSEEPGYRASAFDLVTRKYPIDLEFNLGQPLRNRDLQRRFWEELVEQLAGAFEVLESGTEITFLGLPRTRIAGVSPRPIVLDDSGRATVELLNPNVFVFRATRRGYNPLGDTLIVGDDPQTIRLEQEPAPKHMVDVGLSTMNFPTASYGYYLWPNYLYAKIGFTTYVAGYYILGELDEPMFFVSEPLTEFHLQIGSYFTPADREARGYAGVLGGLRLLHSTFLFSLEPLSKFLVGPVAGFEFEPFGHVLAFFEWSPVILFTDEIALLGSSFPGGYDPFAIADFEIGLVEFLRFRVGARFQW